MSGRNPRKRVEALLAEADVRVGGGRPWDLHVHDERFFRRVLAEGSMGLGESYMDGWWDSPRVDDLVARVLRAGLARRLVTPTDLLAVLRARIFNLQKLSRAFEIGHHHYDLGNDLYERMLDPRMVYSCGYWRGVETLAGAQEAKLDLVCRKLELAPGMRVLDVGCGWGGAAAFAAERYGVEVVGVTVSEAQVRWARRRWKGLPVEFRLEDYRRLGEHTDGDARFDRIFSLGMFEHVGHRNHRIFMKVVRRHLAPDGIFLLHTIGRNRTSAGTDPWIARYIFPNSMIPSARQITRAAEGSFVLEDWHSFGADYDRTLLAWHCNVDGAWNEVRRRYGERFERMWRYYLLSCAGSFRARQNQLWQIVLTP
ncbi:MAG: cyclopropane fatty acyl phospholipid synthase, partial [Gemmatimonadota bacterium]